MPSVPPPVLQNMVLLRPFHPVDEMEVGNEWLLVTDNRISFDGKECNKIGVGYTAF